MEKEIQIELDRLEQKIQQSISKSKEMIETYGLFSLDIFIGAILNRTINLIDGFIQLMKQSNFIASAPIVRLHLDSLLRLYASFQIDFNPDEFANKVISGVRIRDIKARDGKKMTDRYLVDSLSKNPTLNWISKLYNVGSGYIHLSDKHIFASIKSTSNSRDISGKIALGSEFITFEEKLAAIKLMISVTDGIFYFINLWIEKKKDL